MVTVLLPAGFCSRQHQQCGLVIEVICSEFLWSMLPVPLRIVMSHLTYDSTDTFAQVLTICSKHHILQGYARLSIFVIGMCCESAHPGQEPQIQYVWNKFFQCAVIQCAWPAFADELTDFHQIVMLAHGILCALRSTDVQRSAVSSCRSRRPRQSAETRAVCDQLPHSSPVKNRLTLRKFTLCSAHGTLLCHSKTGKPKC